MPGNILNADIGFPSFSGAADRQLGEVKDYLYMLLEQLRYSMGNLGVENFSDAGLEDITNIITTPVYAVIKDEQQNIASLILTADTLSSRLTDAEGNISAVQQTAESITFSVDNGSDSSKITLMRDGVAVKSENIYFSGMVSFGDLSSKNNYTTINGGNIKTGEIDAVDIRGVNIYGSTFYDANSVGALTLSSTDGNYSDLYFRHVKNGNTYDLFSVVDEIGSATLSLAGVAFATANMAIGNITLKNCTVSAVFG